MSSDELHASHLKRNKMPGMNGTHLSCGAVALTVGDFFELAAGFGEQLVGLGTSLFGSGFLPSKKMPGI